MLLDPFHTALTFHRAGHLEEAERRYLEVVDNDSQHADALAMLGALYLQRGDFALADTALVAALSLRPRWASVLSNRAVVLHHIGRLDDALALFDDALAIKPDFADALSNRGSLLVDLGRYDDAVSSFSAALRYQPDHASALRNRANALARGQRNDGVHVLVRGGGLGDVLMALCAAKAIKVQTRSKIVVITAPSNRALVVACPHVDEVICDEDSMRLAKSGLMRSGVHVWELDPVSFGIAREHQVDAYLSAMGLSAPAAQKELDLAVPPEDEEQSARVVAELPQVTPGRGRFLLHPGMTDPGRTWPQARWEELATALLAEGHQVLRIGAGRRGDARSVMDLAVPGVFDTANRLSMLATVALMRRSDVLVSADGGPIQLAAASDIGIVGLYSVVSGVRRLPFRHGEATWRARAVAPACPSYPCYDLMHDRSATAPYNAAIRAGTLDVPKLFAGWCVQADRYRCMHTDINVEQVLTECRALLAGGFGSTGTPVARLRFSAATQ